MLGRRERRRRHEVAPQLRHEEGRVLWWLTRTDDVLPVEVPLLPKIVLRPVVELGS